MFGWGLDKPDLEGYLAKYRWEYNSSSEKSPGGVMSISEEIPFLAEEWANGQRATVTTFHDMVDFPTVAETWDIDLMRSSIEPDQVFQMHEVLRLTKAFAASVAEEISKYQTDHDGEEPPLPIRKEILERVKTQTGPIPDRFS